MSNENTTNAIDSFKQLLGSKVEFWQPTILYTEEIKTGFNKKSTITYPFTPANIFKTEKDAEIFAAIYIKSLIHEGNLPPESITSDNKINEEIINVYTNKVILTAIDVDEG